MRKISLKTIGVIVKDYNYTLSKHIKPFAKKYEDLYYIENLILYENGCVYDIKKNRMLKFSFDKYGYKYVTINKKKYGVHRLVALGFVHWDYQNTLVCHKNKCRSDCRALNLMWVNNNFINMRRKNFSMKNKGRGINAYTKDLKFIGYYDNANRAERDLNLNRSEIYRCCKGERKTTGGYTFRYADSDELR